VKSPKLGAAIAIALLTVYLLVLTNWAIGMIVSGSLIGVAMGLLVLTFPILGGYAIFRELRFGLRVEKMGRELESKNEWPVFQLVLRPSGRPTRDSADENFRVYADAAKANPKDWKAQFALSLAYDACGDRPRARKAMAEAMALHRQ
jgi:hypothetical protein